MRIRCLLALAALALLATPVAEDAKAANPASRGATAGVRSALGTLPAGFSGVLPCSGCPGERWQVQFFDDGAFYLARTLMRPGRDESTYDLGSWTLGADGSTLTLLDGDETPERFLIVNPTTLRRVTPDGRPAESGVVAELRRTAALEPFEPRLTLRGMVRSLPAAATFAECLSGQRWPLVRGKAGDPEHALEMAARRARPQAGEEVLAQIEGRLALRARPGGRGPERVLVVERFLRVAPGETCGARASTSSLEGTRWVLEALGDKPVVVRDARREPFLAFDGQAKRVTGNGGCNRLTGGYTLAGESLRFSAVIMTRMACDDGMETEQALASALESTRFHRLRGHELELLDAGRRTLARFEARDLR